MPARMMTAMRPLKKKKEWMDRSLSFRSARLVMSFPLREDPAAAGRRFGRGDGPVGPPPPAQDRKWR